MLRDLKEFLAAFLREWVVVLTGGVVIALLTLYEFLTGKSVTQGVASTILVLLFLVVSFRMWRKQWVEASREMPSTVFGELTKLVQTQTEVSSVRLIRPYLRKRVRVTGTVQNLLQPRWWLGMVYLQVEGHPNVYLSCMFWEFRAFETLRVGTTVNVLGRIQTVGNHHVILDDIDLLGVDAS